jgi:hypothetical protein
MPAADELFRTTAGGAALLQSPRPEEPAERPNRFRAAVPAPAPEQAQPAAPADRAPEPTSTPTPTPRRGQAPVAEQSRPAPEPPRQRSQSSSAPRRPSGRERHDEKITVYVSPDELLGLEHARITLRGEYGVAVDRGRIVREAVAALLADLDARGPDSILVKRLSSGG